MVLYVFRRRLGMSIAETRALPWWEREVYLEGLINEFAPDDEGDEQVGNDPTSLTGMGLSVETVTV